MNTRISSSSMGDGTRTPSVTWVYSITLPVSFRCQTTTSSPVQRTKIREEIAGRSTFFVFPPICFSTFTTGK